MCRRIVYTHICGHSTETTTRCSSATPWSVIIPKRCLSTFKLPETKWSEHVCTGCAIAEQNTRRKAKEEAERKYMEEVGKEMKLRRQQREKEIQVAEEEAEIAKKKAEWLETSSTEYYRREEEILQHMEAVAKGVRPMRQEREKEMKVARQEAWMAEAKLDNTKEKHGENEKAAKKVVEDTEKSPWADID